MLKKQLSMHYNRAHALGCVDTLRDSTPLSRSSLTVLAQHFHHNRIYGQGGSYNGTDRYHRPGNLDHADNDRKEVVTAGICCIRVLPSYHENDDTNEPAR